MSAKDLALGQGQVKALPGRKGDQGPKGDPGIDGLPGPPGPNGESIRWRGRWSGTTSYQPLDAVEYEGSSYICTDATSARPPGAGWDLMAQKGKDGTGGNQQLVKGFGAIGGAGGGVNIGASNTTYTSGTVIFSGNGNVTVATNGQTVLISAAAGAGGLGAIANSETTYTSGTVALSGLGNVTVRSTTGNAFQISVPAQSVQAETQTFLSGVGNSQTTYTSGNVLLSGLGAVTIDSTTGQAFRINVPVQSVQAETQTFLGAIGNSQTTYTSGTVNLSVEGGLMTIRSTTGQAFRFSISQSVQAETQTFVGGVGNSETTYTSGTVNLSALANITIRSTTGNAFQFSVAAPGAGGGIALQNSETTYTSGTVNLSVVGGALTIRSTTGNAFQFSASQSVQAETQTFVGGVGNSETTYTSGTVNLSGLANITIRSTTGNAFQFSVAAPGAGGANTGSRWNNFGAGTGAQLQTTNLTASTRSLFVFPIDPINELFPFQITASTVRMLLSVSASTASITNQHSVGFSLGIYVVSGSASQSTLSLINSVGSTWTKTTLATSAAVNSYGGIRWVEFASSQWSSQPVFSAGVRYFGAFLSSWSSISFNTMALYGGSHLSTFNASGTFNAASATNTSRGFSPYAGIYTATTAAFPASIHVNQLNKQTGNANLMPYIEMDGLFSAH